MANAAVPNNGQIFKLKTPNFIAKVYTAYDRNTDQFKAVYRITNTKTGQLIRQGDFGVALKPIKEQVVALMNQRRSEVGGDVEIGWSLRGALKTATKLGTKVATMRTLRTLKTIMTDPRFVAAAGVVYPPLGVNIAMIKKGSAVLDAARAGDPTAKAKLAQVNALAYEGNPDAIKLRKALRAMYMAKAAGVDVNAKISGWIYHKAYRADGETHRGTYARGLVAAD